MHTCCVVTSCCRMLKDCESCGTYTNTYSPGTHRSIMFSKLLGKCNKLSHNFLYIIIKLQWKLAEFVSSDDCANPSYKRTQQPNSAQRAQDPMSQRQPHFQLKQEPADECTLLQLPSKKVEGHCSKRRRSLFSSDYIRPLGMATT